MSAQSLQPELQAIAEMDGLSACAVVDAATGMVLQSAGPLDQIPVAEAATDYWRMCGRQAAAFGRLGDLRVLVAIHQRARLTILPCGPGLLLVCVSEENDRVDWNRWRGLVGRLHASTRHL